MQVSHSNKRVFVSPMQIGALFSPSLNPPIKCGAKKGEGAQGHRRVFFVKPPLLQIGLIRQPRLVEKSGLNDIHLLKKLAENELRSKTIPIKRLKRRLPAPHAAPVRVMQPLTRASDVDHTLEF